MATRRATWSFTVLAIGCANSGSPASVDSVEWGPQQVCADPGDGLLDLEDQALGHGIDHVVVGQQEPSACNWTPGGVVAQDLDLDGDIDLLFHRRDAFPWLYENDGEGQFTRHEIDLGGLPENRRVTAIAAIDLDGDRLPEVLATGIGFLARSANLGGLSFDTWSALHLVEGFPRTCHATLAAGDPDADGDLDFILPGLDGVPEEGWLLSGDDEDWIPTHDVLLENDGGAFVDRGSLAAAGDEPSLTLVAAWTDYDGDADVDLWTGTDRPDPSLVPPAQLYRNDGPVGEWPALTDVSTETGADLRVAAMGLGVRDLNRDGRLDYCMSDMADALTCMLSTSQGGFAVAGEALGLRPDWESHPELPPDWDQLPDDPGTKEWVTWGLVVEDLDNDGNPDLAVTASPEPEAGTPALTTTNQFQPDWLFRGLPDGGFASIDPGESGFHSTQYNHGLVSADIDGDGARELITGPFEGRPQLYDTPCTAGAWLEVDLVGPDDNTGGYGALVEVAWGDRRDIQEMHNLAAVGQSPSQLHFGLGDADRVERLTVSWPDGTRTEVRDVGPRRWVRVWHPRATGAPPPAPRPR